MYDLLQQYVKFKNQQCCYSPVSILFSLVIQITAPLQQQLVYQTNSTILCSSVNNTLVTRFIGNDDPIEYNGNGTYSNEDDGLHITSVQFYHQQQYRCEHTISLPVIKSRSIIIDVVVVGMYLLTW